MFDKFGVMTAEQINQAAEGLFNEGDLDDLRELAKENGLDPEMTELYLEGELPELCDAATAAIGKLEIEKQEKDVKAYNSKIPADPIVEYLKGQCEKEEVALAIRRPEKTLLKCLKHIETEARKIVRKPRPWLSDAAVYQMAKEYYLGGSK